MTRSLLPLALLAVAACDDPDTEVNAGSIAALQQQLAALEADAAERQTAVEALQTDVEALASSETVAGLSSRVTDLENAGYATETWVTEQGYDAAIAAVATTAAANTVAAAEAQSTADAAAGATADNALALGLATSRIDGLDDDLDTLSSEFAAAEAVLTTVADDLDDAEANLATNASDIADLRDDVDSNRADIDRNATTGTTNASDIATNASGIADNASGIADNASDLTELTTDLDDLATELADMEDLVTVHYTRFTNNVGWTTTGYLSNRKITVNKKRNDTVLVVEYYDNFYTRPASTSCTYEVHFDRRNCTSPGTIDTSNWANSSTALHRHGVIQGVCSATSAGNLAAGNHEIEIYTRPTTGYSGQNCYTGWTTGGSIVVRELLK